MFQSSLFVLRVSVTQILFLNFIILDILSSIAYFDEKVTRHFVLASSTNNLHLDIE